MRVLAMTGLALAGCAYEPGSFHSISQPFSGHELTIGCIDIAIDRRADLPSGDAVVSYSFGNRCDHPAVVDLAKAKVFGRSDDGSRIDLVAYDPRHEIEALWLDGRAVGREAIAYPSESPLSEVCVDAASIAREGTVQWLCLASRSQHSEVVP
jgi:hypothetical protein